MNIQVRVYERQVLVYRGEHLVGTTTMRVPSVSVGMVVIMARVQVVPNAHHVPLVTVESVLTVGIDDPRVGKMDLVEVGVTV